MHFLISGIPASGKSTFCRWLEGNKGFLHLNVEEDGVLDRHGLATAWATLFDASIMLWWFAADWTVARRKFVERGGKGPVAVFDIQIRKIEAALPEINAL